MTQSYVQLNKNREGIALIMVIGLLALMMVLGVAFAIYMRTGRVAAGNYRSDLVTRQLLPVALNRALGEIESSIGTSIYPPWDVLCSSSNSLDGSGDTAQVTNSANLSWIPTGVLALTNQVNPTWAYVGNNGRVAFIVLNCSGLLDVNYAGGGAVRGCGANASEIQVSALAEVNNSSAFTNGRPYETVQELGVKGTTETPAPLKAAPANLVTYSCFPRTYFGGTNLPVSLTGSLNTPARSNDIVKAFFKSGITLANAPNVYLALLDYVDADDVPQNLWSMCTEAVPMFNEVRVTLAYSSSGGASYSLKSYVDVETYYPFVKGTTSNYFIDCSMVLSAASAGFPLPAPALTSGVSVAVVDPSAPWWLKSKICQASLAAQSYASYTSSVNYVTGRVSLVMHSGTASGPVVDAVPTNAAGSLSFNFVLPVNFSGPVLTFLTNSECIDPRFNWDPKNWKGALGSLGFENDQTKAHRIASAADVDGDTKMFVANAPLKSIAELSYLPRASSGGGAFWRTIRVYPAPTGVESVLDCFALDASPVMKGAVNPNTRSVEVMKALLTDMKADEYPGGPDSASSIDVPALASAWINSAPPITKISDLSLKCTNLMTVAPFSGASVFRQESLLRNMVGLLHPRQNYFMVLISAQTCVTLPKSLGVTQKIAGSTASGVAEVWRDPLPNASGQYEIYVRMLKTLEE